MPRSRHAKKEIEAVLVYAETHGWRIEPASGHAWGDCIAHIMIMSAAVVSFVSSAFGVLRRIRPIMPGNCVAWSIIVRVVHPPGRTKRNDNL